MQMNYNKESKDLDILIEKFNYATNFLNKKIKAVQWQSIPNWPLMSSIY